MKAKERFKSFLLSLLSRKFLLALVGAIVVLGNRAWGWELSEEEVWKFLVPLLAFIGMEGFADARERG